MVAFYNQRDQELYKDFQYLPQEQYRLGLGTNTNIPNTLNFSNLTSGIMSQRPLPSIYPINAGGGGEGGGIMDAAPTGAFDYEFDALGGVPNPDNVGLTEAEQDDLNEFSNPGLNMADLGTLGSMAFGFTTGLPGVLGLIANRQRKQRATMDSIEAEKNRQEVQDLQERIDRGDFGGDGNDSGQDTSGASGGAPGGGADAATY
jgi:hypothetical protein